MENKISERISSLSHVVGIETRCLNELLHSHKNAFAWKGTPLGRTSVLKHQMEKGDTAPIRQRPRRVLPLYHQEFQKLIDQMLKDNVIRPLQSPWVLPIVLVKQKNGSQRMCVDYRILNGATRKVCFPLPRINDTLEAMHGSK